MKRTVSLVLTTLSLLALLRGEAAAQASAAEMDAFPMPPPSGYVATKSFAYAGDYGYYTAPSPAVYSTGAGPSDYRYVRYTNLDDKHVYLYGAWGPTSIGAPSGGGDNCGHAHASYGVWARYELNFGWLRFSGWARIGGGGMSGVREGSRCVHKTDNPLSAIDSRFGWGSDFFELNCLDDGCWLFTDLVLGALSNTHGWGSCSVPAGQFPACTEPSYLIGYSLAW